MDYRVRGILIPNLWETLGPGESVKWSKLGSGGMKGGHEVGTL